MKLFCKMGKKRTVYYTYDQKATEISKNIPNIGSRAAVVHSLTSSYNLFSRCKLCTGRLASDEELQSFHSSSYIECLKKVDKTSDLEKMTDSEEAIDFNLGYDCPLFEHIYDFAKIIAGNTLAAAEKLINKEYLHIAENKVFPTIKKSVSKPKSYLKIKAEPAAKRIKKEEIFDLPENLTIDETIDLNDDFENNLENNTSHILEKKIDRLSDNTETTDPLKFNISEAKENVIAINWLGGWHHAQRDEAEGFCYVNDIVIAIQYLLKVYKKILYIDLDVHHGNGVENAFLFSPRVFKFSLHKYETGFYPASGSLNDIGEGNGKYHTVNVPLKSGITDEKYVNVFKTIFSAIIQKYKPECLVIQCGADCIAGDPLGGLNLTPVALGKCLRVMLNEELPSLILGGGGYNIPNTARCWAYLTSVALDCEISEDIPENHFFHLFGPDFNLNVVPSLRRDENSDVYLKEVVNTILKNLENLPDLKH